MDIKQCKKIAIFGMPGSGKSFLARELGRILNLPVYHMDLIRGTPGWDGLTFEERLPILNAVIYKEINKPEWIIDGNQPSFLQVLEARLSSSDLVIYIDMPKEQCIDSVAKRQGTPRPDCFDATLEDQTKLERLIEIIENYQPQMNLIKEYINKHAASKYMELAGRDEVNKFINSLMQHVKKEP